MSNKFVGAAKFFSNLVKGAQKTTGTGAIDKVNISKNLKEFQKHKADIIKSTDKHTKGLTTEGSINVKKTVSPALSKLSKLTQKMPVKKAKGGRVGLKAGTNPFMRKSNIKKIQETFGPKKDKKRINAKKGFPDLSGDGKTTFKDILIGRGVIKKKNGKKKKVI